MAGHTIGQNGPHGRHGCMADVAFDGRNSIGRRGSAPCGVDTCCHGPVRAFRGVMVLRYRGFEFLVSGFVGSMPSLLAVTVGRPRDGACARRLRSRQNIAGGSWHSIIEI